jgi:hypothetical protein
MSKSNCKALIITFTMMITGLSAAGLSQVPQPVYSQTDYEEYIVMEDINKQKINQKNVGSGSSTNVNCGTNIAGSNLVQPITCPSIPGETPAPSTTVIPIVTQRVVEVQSTELGIENTAQAPCNPDEVVTGGGYDVSELLFTEATVIEEFAVNNAWHIKTIPTTSQHTIRVFAECLKLVPD